MSICCKKIVPQFATSLRWHDQNFHSNSIEQNPFSKCEKNFPMTETTFSSSLERKRNSCKKFPTKHFGWTLRHILWNYFWSGVFWETILTTRFQTKHHYQNQNKDNTKKERYCKNCPNWCTWYWHVLDPAISFCGQQGVCQTCGGKHAIALLAVLLPL